MTRGIEVRADSEQVSRQLLIAIAGLMKPKDSLYVPLLDLATNTEYEPRVWDKDALAQELERCYQPLFMELFVYPPSADCGYPEDYGAFMASSCKMALLFWDGGFFDIYVKDKNTAAAVYSLCKQYSPNGTEYITEETDGRTAFRVW